MLLWAKQPSPPLPQHPPKKKILQGNSWFAFYRSSQFGIWKVFNRFSFPDCFSVREAVEKKTGGNMRREMHFSRLAGAGALLYLFTTEMCEISFTTVTVSMRN